MIVFSLILKPLILRSKLIDPCDPEKIRSMVYLIQEIYLYSTPLLLFILKL